MGSIIKSNGLKREGRSPGVEKRGGLDVRVAAEQHSDMALTRPGDEGGIASFNLGEEEKRERRKDGISGLDVDGPLQFHHLTRREFEARKVRMRADEALV